MTLWVVRAGDEGQQEKGAIENNIVAIGWNRLPDLSVINDYESLEKIYREKYPESEHEKETNYDRSVSLHAGEVWSFIGKIKIGDLVALPSKFSEYIHIGEVSGNYEFKVYADNIKHTLPVRWIKVVSKNEIPEEFQTSFNTQLTVFAITRHDAENKIKKLIDAQQESQYFLIQVSDLGSPTVLEKGFYEHLDWFENTADSAHGEVKQGDIILVYFASKSIDYKKTLKMVYKVSKITDNNIRFYLTLFKKLNGISYEEIKRYIDNAQLNNDSFWGIGNQSFNIGKISKADFDKVFELDGSTLDPIVDEKRFQIGHELFEKEMSHRSNGVSFQNFNHPSLLSDEINYKKEIVEKTKHLRVTQNWAEWVQKEGTILEELKEACSQKVCSNLLMGSNYGIGGSSSASLHLIDEAKVGEFEREIMSFFLGGMSTPENFAKPFDDLIEFLKKNNLKVDWRFLAYLAFLSNPEKYFPIQPTPFEKLLEFYGNSYKFRANFSWQLYSAILQVAEILKSKLSHYGKIDQIQIQSYMWVISKLIDREELPPLEETMTEQQIPEKYQEYEDILLKKKQLIFYGPSGTGKTFTANKFADWFVSKNSPVTDSEDISTMSDDKFKNFVIKKIEKLANTNNYELFKDKSGSNLYTLQNSNNELRLAFVFSKSGKSNKTDVWVGVSNNVLNFWKKGDEAECFHVIVNCDTKSFVVLPVEIERKYARYSKTVATESDDFNMQNRYDFHINIDESEAKLHTRDGTYDEKFLDCNSYLNNLEKLGIGNSIAFDSTDSQVDFVRKVTFHPSYSYEEFVEGIKPKSRGDYVEYPIEPGIFKTVCQEAADDTQNRYVLVIDEINRGNISKILGELITLIEMDKRGTYSLTLAYSKKPFTVPQNLHIIGTMNTADRSLTLLDVALRRRFAFCELLPDTKLINKTIEGVHLGTLLTKLNERIRNEGLREKQIGHSYFMKGTNPITTIDELKFAFANEIIPLVQDYFYEDYEKIRQILSSKFVNEKEMMIRSEWKYDDALFIDALKEIIANE